MNHTGRTILVGLLLGLMATAIYILLPKSAITNLAYATTLVGIVVFVLSILVLTQRTTRLPQDVVFPMAAWAYLSSNLLLTAVVGGRDLVKLWSTPWPIFCIAHTLLLGFFTVRILVLSAGKEHIEQVGEAVAETITNWRLLLADLDAIKHRVPTAFPNDQRVVKEMQAVFEAFRYSDPISKPAFSDLDRSLQAGVAELGRAMNGCRADEIAALCAKLLQELRNRNTRLSASK